ncbi:MAG: DUF1800 family protein [Acidobacteria bacterium]|nr:DUF1800 family protein [Acidobacteriota bacterium]
MRHNRLASWGNWGGALLLVLLANVTFAQAQTTVAAVSAASYDSNGCAPDSIAAAFGTQMTAQTAIASTVPLPTTLGNTKLIVRDSANIEREAQLFFVSPTQINFLIPKDTAAGSATLSVREGTTVKATGTLKIASVAPGVFTLNASGQGLAAAVYLRVKANSAQSYESVGRFDTTAGKFMPVLVNLGPEGEAVYLILYGTGLRNRTAVPTAKINNVAADVAAAGALPGFSGLDQINIRIPRTLPGCGTMQVALTVDGKNANVVEIGVQALAATMPAGLAAAGGAGEVALTWSPVAGVTRYKLQRATSSNGTYAMVATPTIASFIDAGLTNGTTYFYKVSADYCGMESTATAAVSATPRSNVDPTLFVASLTPEGQAQSGGSGVSTLLLSADEKTAKLKFNFSNLTTAKMAAHIHGPADPGKSGQILFDLDDSPQETDGSFNWAFTDVGVVTTPQIIAALKTGRLYVNIHSSRFPSGEIRGHFRLANGSQTFTPPPPPPPLPTGTPSARDAARFLTQATFGPTPAEMARVQQIGYDAWLTEQFAKPVTMHSTYLDVRKTAGDTLNIDHSMEAFWQHAIAGNDQLRARVMFALSQIFVVSCDSGALENEAMGISHYADILSLNAFGDFRQMLGQITLHPSMGVYLDMLKNDKGDPSTGREPNENFAREILQLFTVGLYQLNPDGTLKLNADGLPIETYNQETIENLARVFTGWNFANSRDTTKPWQWTWPPVRHFRLLMQAWPEHHDTGEKVLLNGFRVPASQTPEKDLKDALDHIANHPNVAPFIARQLIQRLVTSNPSPAYVYRVAAKFNNNGSGVRGDLKAVVRAILLDYEARSLNVINDQGYGKQREPVIRFAHLFRAFNIRNADGRYRIHHLESPLWGLGQNPLRAPTVFNFFEPTFAQPGAITEAGLVAPEFKITTETSIIGSSNTMRGLAFNGYNGGSMTTTYAEYTPLSANPAQLVDRLNLTLTNNAMSDELRARLLTAINSIPTSRSTWQVDRVKNAIWLISLSPEFVIQK